MKNTAKLKRFKSIINYFHLNTKEYFLRKNNYSKTQTLQISKLNFSKSKKIYLILIAILMREIFGTNQKQHLLTTL